MRSYFREKELAEYIISCALKSRQYIHVNNARPQVVYFIDTTDFILGCVRQAAYFNWLYCLPRNLTAGPSSKGKQLFGKDQVVSEVERRGAFHVDGQLQP
jgi:hypothetical protein